MSSPDSVSLLVMYAYMIALDRLEVTARLDWGDEAFVWRVRRRRT